MRPSKLLDWGKRLFHFGQREQAPLREGNSASLYEDGGTLLEASRESIRRARRSIDIEMYIWSDDEVGLGFCELLEQSLARGVSVRILYDALGCWNSCAPIEALKGSGATVVAFRPLAPWRIRANPNRRNHRKLLVVDDTVAIVGGANWGSDYDSHSNPESFLDVGIGVAGAVVGDLMSDFRRVWAIATGENLPPPLAPLPDLDPPGKPYREVPMQMVSGIQRGDRSAIRALYGFLIRQARTEVFVANSYFVPGRGLVRQLAQAARANVDITLLLPGHTDMKWVQMAGRATYERLLQGGVKIYERKDRMFHGKVAVVDGQVAVVGSCNIDPRSFRHNLELNLNAWHPELATALRKGLGAETLSSLAMELESFRRRPLRDRIWSRFAYAMKYWL